MNSQELRNLQEAYMEVVMNEGDVDSPYDRAQTNRADAYGRAQTNRADAYGRAQKKKKEKTQKEQVDLYDIILSHLLDEGYAETQEQAEVIMVNMSEDWRESIVEEVLDEVAIYKRGGKGQTTETPLQIYGKSATAREKKKLHNIPKGRIGANEVGDYDRGSGNAAKRRAAALTKPEAKK